MAERWRYAERKHPPFCTCVTCKGDESRRHFDQPSNQLGATLQKWRTKNFDPHYILGVSPNSSRKQIVEAHRRWITVYHPDRHNDDPVATELTKHLNAARDELLGKGNQRSQIRREQQRKQREASQRAHEAERRKQEEERQQRADKAGHERKQEEARQRGVHEAERLMREAARRRQQEERRKQEEEQRQHARKVAQQQRQNEAWRRREKAQQQRANRAEKRRRENEQRKRAREAEQQRRQEEARRQSVSEAERLMRDAQRRRQRSQPSVQPAQRIRRKGSLVWSLLAITLATLVVTHLVLIVESPDAVDNIMNNWARLFDQALARQ